MKVVDSLICGFGFGKTTLMRAGEAGIRFSEVKDEDSEAVIGTLNPYSDAQRRTLPRFVLKTADSKFAIYSVSEATDRWKALKSTRGMSYSQTPQCCKRSL